MFTRMQNSDARPIFWFLTHLISSLLISDSLYHLSFQWSQHTSLTSSFNGVCDCASWWWFPCYMSAIHHGAWFHISCLTDEHTSARGWLLSFRILLAPRLMSPVSVVTTSRQPPVVISTPYSCATAAPLNNDLWAEQTHSGRVLPTPPVWTPAISGAISDLEVTTPVRRCAPQGT